MKRAVVFISFVVLTLFSISVSMVAADKSSAPRCIKEACAAALKAFDGTAPTSCKASYVQLADKTTEAWLVTFDGETSKVQKVVDAKTGEILADTDLATVKKCGPRPFACPEWVYQPCPSGEEAPK